MGIAVNVNERERVVAWVHVWTSPNHRLRRDGDGGVS